MRQHFNVVDKKIGTGLWGGDLYVAAGYSFCDGKLRAELEDFYRQHQFEGKEREEKRMLERIRECFDPRRTPRSVIDPVQIEFTTYLPLIVA